MSAFADRIAATVKRLGEPVVLSYQGSESFDADNGAYTPGSATTLDAYGAPSSYRAGEIDGTLIQSGDIRLTLQQVTTVPEIGWSVTLDSKVYRVMNVERVRKSAETVVYILQLRRS